MLCKKMRSDKRCCRHHNRQIMRELEIGKIDKQCKNKKHSSAEPFFPVRTDTGWVSFEKILQSQEESNKSNDTPGRKCPKKCMQEKETILFANWCAKSFMSTDPVETMIP